MQLRLMMSANAQLRIVLFIFNVKFLWFIENKVSEFLLQMKKLLNYFWNVDKIGYLCTTFKGYSTTESWVSG